MLEGDGHPQFIWRTSGEPSSRYLRMRVFCLGTKVRATARERVARCPSPLFLSAGEPRGIRVRRRDLTVFERFGVVGPVDIAETITGRSSSDDLIESLAKAGPRMSVVRPGPVLAVPFARTLGRGRKRYEPRSVTQPWLARSEDELARRRAGISIINPLVRRTRSRLT